MVSTPRSKQEHALELVGELLDDLDSEKVRTSTALQRLKRIAKLVTDTKLLGWIAAEESGYPIHVTSYAEAERAIADHLKAEKPDKKTVAELTKKVYRPLPEHRVGWFSGEHGSGGRTVALGGPLGEYEALLESIRREPKTRFTFVHEGQTLIWSAIRLQRLVEGVRSRIYDEATRLQELLLFGQIPANAIDRTFTFVDAELFRMMPATAERLTTAYQNLAERREENWINVVDTCRRVVKDFADEIYPASTTPAHGLDVSEDKYLNRIRAFVKDSVESRRQSQQLDSVLAALAELLARTDNLASRSVHEGRVSRFEAERVLLYTYLAVGDILVLSGLATRADAIRDRISISKADVTELTGKLGLKPAIAEAIVRFRRSKPFRSWNDVAAVPGIGEKTLHRLQENASL